MYFLKTSTGKLLNFFCFGDTYLLLSCGNMDEEILKSVQVSLKNSKDVPVRFIKMMVQNLEFISFNFPKVTLTNFAGATLLNVEIAVMVLRLLILPFYMKSTLPIMPSRGILIHGD